MDISPKKRIQVQVDKELADDTEQVLQKLGLTPTTAITMLYKRIVAQGGLPFDMQLTEDELIALRLSKEVEKLPVKKFKNAKEVEDWLNDENED